jgi:hypothetical protein
MWPTIIAERLPPAPPAGRRSAPSRPRCATARPPTPASIEDDPAVRRCRGSGGRSARGARRRRDAHRAAPQSAQCPLWTPGKWARARRLPGQVAALGVVSKVLAIAAATCSSVTVRGPPGRGMSPSPAIRCATNRALHRPTACGVDPSWAATSLFDAPAAHAKMIRHRNAHACGVDRRHTQPSSAARSSPESDNSTLGRPVLRHPKRPYTSEQNS